MQLPESSNEFWTKESAIKIRALIFIRLDIEPLVPEMDPGKLKIATNDPNVGEELLKYSKEFRAILFPISTKVHMIW